MNLIFRSVTWTLAALGAIGATGTAAKQSPGSLAFQRLASLAGEWKGVREGTEFQVIYTLTASGSVLMEEFRPRNGSMMVTMFSVNGDHLIATHYCSARNQPQMATTAITDPQAKSLAFSLIRVTGMTSPDDWHNTGLVVTFHDPDHVTQEWTYREKNATGRNVFQLTRVKPRVATLRDRDA